MKAENARDVRFADRRNRQGPPLGVVRDERRQKAGGARRPNRPRDRSGSRGCRCIIEQHAARAIDLYIEKARREQAAIKVLAHDVGGKLRGWQHIDDGRCIEQHSVVVEKMVTREDAGTAKCLERQIVSVTFRNRLGLSGSCPRIRDTTSARP